MPDGDSRSIGADSALGSTEPHLMYNELLLFAIVGSITGWLAIKHAITVARSQRQIEIMRRGQSCQGRIVGIQRPFMLDACTRLYFDFVPEGSEQPLRACHIDHRSADAVRRTLPPSGAIVSVRYLPDRPKHAVISGLVSPSLAAHGR